MASGHLNAVDKLKTNKSSNMDIFFSATYWAILLMLSLPYCHTLFATEALEEKKTVIYRSDFSDNPNLLGWFDVGKSNPKNKRADRPRADWYSVASSEARPYLKTEKVLFGISSLLTPPLLLDDSIARVELQVTFRCPTASSHPIAMALSSRTDPAGSNGGPFWKGRKDEGIYVQGYQHNLQYANYIASQKEGRQIKSSAWYPPFKFLRKSETWSTWRLVYDNIDKTLAFFDSEEASQPFVLQYQVNLSGVVLRSVWLGAWGTEYAEVKVFYVETGK